MRTEAALRRLQFLSRCIKKAQYSTCAAQPTIHLSKESVLIDEKVQITVKGLNKHQKVTLHSFLEDSEKRFAACGHYIADESGEVNTFEHYSHGGTFEDIEPMGLFWSKRSQNTEQPKRILKEDVTTPFHVKLALHDGFLNFEDLPWTDKFPCLSECILRRHYTAPGVKRISVEENGLYGTLFLPPGKGPFPAVIDIFGMTGGIAEMRSSLLASHGIAGFSLGYVNFADLPKNENELDFNYFLKAFDWLVNHPAINENSVGGISTCVGGSYVGVIAMKRPAMKCFVCINNSYCAVGIDQVLEGEPVESSAFAYNRITKNQDGVIFRSMYDDSLVPKITPIWRHGIKVLHIHGLDDQCVHPNVANKLKQVIPPEFKDNFTYIEYPGAGHLIEPPYMPLCKASYNQIFRQYLLWGGEPKLHADAQEDSWPKILDFLHTYLSDSTSQ